MVKNGDLLAVFNSAHRVMKAESILKNSNLPILLIPAPRALSADCGLALRFSDACYNSVMQTLQHHDLLPAFVTRRVTATDYQTVWHSDEPTTLPTGDKQNEEH